MKIGEQLRTIRKGAGLTQEDVAQMLNITRQALSNWEQGKAIPDLYTFARLASVYHFSPDEFLLGKSSIRETEKLKTNYSDAQIEKLIQRRYPDMTELTPLSGGLVSQTFSFQCRDRKYIFQIGGKHDDYEKQLYISRKYGSVIPVRDVISVHETEDGIAYCFSHFIIGRKLFDLSDRERREIVIPALDALSKMSGVEISPSTGYGRFDSNGNAPYKSWNDFISVIYNDKVCDWSALALKGFTDTVVRKAIAELQKNIHHTEFDKSYLVNGDAGSYNIIALDGRITGLIDCGSALYGDPLYCIANLLYWNEDKLHDLLMEIRRRYLNDDTNERELYCYALRIGLEEIYNTVVLNEIGYDISWVNDRLNDIVENGLK